MISEIDTKHTGYCGIRGVVIDHPEVDVEIGSDGKIHIKKKSNKRVNDESMKNEGHNTEDEQLILG